MSANETAAAREQRREREEIARIVGLPPTARPWMIAEAIDAQPDEALRKSLRARLTRPAVSRATARAKAAPKVKVTGPAWVVYARTPFGDRVLSIHRDEAKADAAAKKTPGAFVRKWSRFTSTGLA